MEKLDKELFDYLNKINTNNNDILLETINELNKLKLILILKISIGIN